MIKTEIQLSKWALSAHERFHLIISFHLSQPSKVNTNLHKLWFANRSRVEIFFEVLPRFLYSPTVSSNEESHFPVFPPF